MNGINIDNNAFPFSLVLFLSANIPKHAGTKQRTPDKNKKI